MWLVPLSESFQSFQWSPLLGSQLWLIPPFCSPKNQVIPLKSSVLPAINNDRCTFETSHIDNKSLNNPGSNFIVELHLIKGHNLEKEKSGFTIFFCKANVICFSGARLSRLCLFFLYILCSSLAKFNKGVFRLTNGPLAQDLFKEFIWNVN